MFQCVVWLPKEQLNHILHQSAIMCNILSVYTYVCVMCIQVQRTQPRFANPPVLQAACAQTNEQTLVQGGPVTCAHATW